MNHVSTDRWTVYLVCAIIIIIIIITTTNQSGQLHEADPLLLKRGL